MVKTLAKISKILKRTRTVHKHFIEEIIKILFPILTISRPQIEIHDTTAIDQIFENMFLFIFVVSYQVYTSLYTVVVSEKIFLVGYSLT